MSTDALTHAKTERQPIAWAVASGHCPIINSTVRPPLEMVGRLIGIHAGKGWRVLTGAEHEALGRAGRIGVIQALNTGQHVGALIGVARLVGVVHMAGSTREDGGPRFWKHVGRSSSVGEYVSDDLSRRIEPWWRGPWGWLLEEAVLLPEPIPMRGQQGLWRLPEVQGGDPWRAAAGVRALEQWRKAREVVR